MLVKTRCENPVNEERNFKKSCLPWIFSSGGKLCDHRRGYNEAIAEMAVRQDRRQDQKWLHSLSKSDGIGKKRHNSQKLCFFQLNLDQNTHGFGFQIAGNVVVRLAKSENPENRFAIMQNKWRGQLRVNLHP